MAVARKKPKGKLSKSISGVPRPVVWVAFCGDTTAEAARGELLMREPQAGV